MGVGFDKALAEASGLVRPPGQVGPGSHGGSSDVLDSLALILGVYDAEAGEEPGGVPPWLQARPKTLPGRPAFEGMDLSECPLIHIEGLEPGWVKVTRDEQAGYVTIHVLQAAEDGFSAKPLALRMPDACARTMGVLVASRFPSPWPEASMRGTGDPSVFEDRL